LSENTTELVAGAHAAFTDAVHALIGLRPDVLERDDFTQPIVRDSLYVELMEARFGERVGETVRRQGTGSRTPGWTDAISLLDRIDRRVKSWWPAAPFEPATQPLTVRRLYALCDYQWCPVPEDLGMLRRMTRDVQAWVERANALLPTEVTHTYELRAACPACGETTTQVDDGSGELVRQYVLQASQSSARCVACETNWDPGQYRLLASMIGADMPAGVLE
jgi:hypothetical protein